MNDRIKINGKEYQIVFDFEAYIILEGLWGFKSMLDFGEKVLGLANQQVTFNDARALLYAGLNRSGIPRLEVDNFLNSQKKPIQFLKESEILQGLVDCFVESLKVEEKEKKAVKNA